jgi:hypothetical protein
MTTITADDDHLGFAGRSRRLVPTVVAPVAGLDTTTTTMSARLERRARRQAARAYRREAGRDALTAGLTRGVGR